MPQRAAVRRDAVPDGGRAHAGLRDHEPRQPRARLALHGRRLPGHRGLQPNRLVPGRGGVRARGHAGHRHAGGGDRAPHPLRARSPGPGPRHLRPDPLLQRGRGHRLGARGAVHRGAARAVRPPPGAAGHPVPRLPRGHHPGGPGRRPAAVRRGEPHPARHADPRRRQQPHDGGRPGREHPPALRGSLRLRRRARRAGRRNGRSDLLGAAGHGRGDPHPGLRRHRLRRHRLDPRRAGGRGGRGHGGHARPGLPQADADHRHRPLRRRQRGAGARLDADLHPDGGRALLPPPGAVPGRPQLMRSARALTLVAAFLVLGLVPVEAALANQPFYLDLFRRIMILAIAAVSLDLILGFGGMVSFGHAAYLGIGAYAVGILGFYGHFNGALHFLVAIAASALVALAIGAVSIRTSGVYFIMITLAFTQMLYYLGISVAEFGGDDGMRLKRRSELPFVDLNDPVQFYYVALALMLLSVFLVYRIVNSRFGMVLRASKSNDARSRAIGFSPYPYRLAAFVIAGAMCGLAGALYGNHTNYITPGLMSRQQSGDIMFMVILGGMASTAGPVLGAFALLLVEDLLSGWTEHWQVILGPLLILSVIFFRRGLAGIFYRPDA